VYLLGANFGGGSGGYLGVRISGIFDEGESGSGLVLTSYTS
jgi:hypothetical protein